MSGSRREGEGLLNLGEESALAKGSLDIFAVRLGREVQDCIVVHERQQKRG
jgi:hypothetical protein